MSENRLDDLEALLSGEQARVLGSLMEKQMTTPDYYPLTLKALQAACNQKSSRQPVMEMDLGRVGAVVNELRAEGLVTARMDGRADRFEQHLSRKFKLTSKERALLCVLLLRGPQTINELRTNTSRMTEFGDTEEILHTLEQLQQEKEMPLVIKLPRATGQREERYGHLLCGMPAVEPPRRATRIESGENPAASERLAELEQQVAEMRSELDLLWQLTGLRRPGIGEREG